MTSKNFTTLHVFDTIYNADSVEWCPISPYKNYFACGTYHLMESNDKSVKGEVKEYLRNGGVSVFTVLNKELKESHNLKCPAVLDMKWCGRKLNNKIVLAVANAVGEVVVYQLENGILKFLTKCVLKKKAGDFLTLSLDWTKQGYDDLICSSDSAGNITIIQFSNDTLNVLQEWNAHSLEAWIVCFDSFQQNVIYSGGDEGQFKVWDCREKKSCELVSFKKHTAGVTALSSNIFNEFNLVSGSYEEKVFFWDTRNWKNPLKEVTASGGLWRLKWEPKNKPYLLAACIYGGFQVYDTFIYKVVSDYKEHESLAYGADWCHLDNTEMQDLGYSNSALVATCSFYDHKLCVSLWKEDEKT